MLHPIQQYDSLFREIPKIIFIIEQILRLNIIMLLLDLYHYLNILFVELKITFLLKLFKRLFELVGVFGLKLDLNVLVYFEKVVCIGWEVNLDLLFCLLCLGLLLLMDGLGLLYVMWVCFWEDFVLLFSFCFFLFF